MTMQEACLSTRGWVDSAQGVVSRAAFVSDDVYRLELARIFEKGWVFLAHHYCAMYGRSGSEKYSLA
jgi:hypothetical protein